MFLSSEAVGVQTRKRVQTSLRYRFRIHSSMRKARVDLFETEAPGNTAGCLLHSGNCLCRSTSLSQSVQRHGLAVMQIIRSCKADYASTRPDPLQLCGVPTVPVRYLSI